jgi:hypothetical protein
MATGNMACSGVRVIGLIPSFRSCDRYVEKVTSAERGYIHKASPRRIDGRDQVSLIRFRWRSTPEILRIKSICT